jgi:copper-binding protein NosD
VTLHAGSCLVARLSLSALFVPMTAAAGCEGASAPHASDVSQPNGQGAPPAATMYVDGRIGPTTCADYSPASRSCGGGSARAFRSLQGAAEAAGPGDVVHVREGTYAERLIPSRSGTEPQPVTWLATPGETVTVTGTDEPAVYLKGRSYVVIDGFTVTNVVGWVRLEDSSHNLLVRNHFSNATARGTTGGVKLVRSHLNRILDNSIEDGNDNLLLQESDHNVVQANVFSRGRHSLLSIRCGNYNVIRGNSFSNPSQKNLEIFDCEGVSDAPVRLDATKRNLVEGNLIADTHPSSANYRYNGIQYGGQQGIVRRNVFRNNQGGGINFQFYARESLDNNRNRVYNNTFYNNRCFGIVGQRGNHARFYDNRVRANLLYRNFNCTGTGSQVSIADPGAVILEENVLATTSPGFVDEAGGDLRLAPGSPMIDAGAFLTTTARAGNGTEMPVADASWFYDGYGIPGETGDAIQLEGRQEVAHVTGVDLSANLLRLDRALTWAAGQGVALRYAGSRPDVGAYEFGLP